MGIAVGRFQAIVDSELIQLLDHRNLNVDVAAFRETTPTVENIAVFAWGRLAGKFDSDSHIVTGRIEFNRIKNLRLAGGATYLDIGRDLDIEKSMLFAEGSFKVLNDYHLEVRYNVYNYDDYILLDRYYTANVVRINLAYDLHL